MINSLNNQVGGNHYKDLKMQPIVLITKTNCNFIQGCIIKYISRYKNKNGKQDIQKCMHYAQLAIDLLPHTYYNTNIDASYKHLAHAFVKTNNMSDYQARIIYHVLEKNYISVINDCRLLINIEYPQNLNDKVK